MTAKCPNCGVNDVKIVVLGSGNNLGKAYCESCFGNEDNYGNQSKTA